MTKSAKRALGLLLIVSAIFSMSGCDFGSKRISDIEQYGQFESYIELPEFFPDSVDGYTVNAYAYHLESWMDTCYEILLDITVAESQFEELLSEVLAQGKECYYSEGFYEFVFEDHYEIFTEEEDSQQVVGYADIEKIIYNPQTNRIVYVALHANDTGVYPLKDVAYFNCFHIDETEYVKHIEYESVNTTVITDEKWLSFVIEQVLSNALKYTPAGSIIITLENEKTLRIRDTGIGIAPEDLPRVFENGYTGYNGRADKKASGIGLYLCKRICNNLGHTITARSIVDVGTIIDIDLTQTKLEVE